MGTFNRASSRARRLAGAAVVAAGLTSLAPLAVGPMAFAAPSGPSASQSPSPSTDAESDDQLSAPGIPMPVRQGALGYLATRSATLWLNDRGADDVLANLPVPPAYSKANRAMADNLDRELTSAVTTPGACLQIIVDGVDDSGGLFTYGFFAVERQYCPK